MLANLDFLRVTPSEKFPAGVVTTHHSVIPPEDIKSIVEVKTTGLSGFGTAHQWGAEDEETMPIGYELQCRHYLLVAGQSEAELVGLLGGRGLQVRHISRDVDYEEYIIDLESRFWAHVVAGTPIEPDGSESADETLKALYPRGDEEIEMEGGSKLDNLWHDFEDAKKRFTEVETEKKELRAKIVALVGSAAYATVHGQRILSFKNSQDSDWFNEKKFAAENPAIYAKYVSKKPGFRTLRAAK